MSKPAIVQSVFDFEIREINALESRIVKAEDDADAMLWEQARHVVAQLAAGVSQRDLAKQWINGRTGEPYSQMHVSFVARLVREKFTFHPRPPFREAYNEISNSSSGNINRLLSQTGDFEWYSPIEIVSAARDVLGAIDLDPASCDLANTKVQASQIYTVEENGLEQPWQGRVFMNPPYRQPDINRWCEKFAAHAKAGEIQGIALINNTTDTHAFRTIAAVATAFCFPFDRLVFWKPDRDTGAAPQGQVVIYAGPDPEAFYRRFDALGLVMVRPVFPCAIEG